MTPTGPVPTRRDDLVTDVHGVEVTDPYRWLEDADDPEVVAWTAAQNARTRAHLDALGAPPGLVERLTRLLGAGTVTATRRRSERLFSLDRWDGRDQATLVWRPTGRRADPAVVVDPVELTGDVTTAVDWYEPSPGGSLVAYGRSSGGDERSTLHVVDVDTGRHLDDVIAHTRASSVAWLPGGDAFVHTRYPAPGTVPAGDEAYWRTVWLHRLGTDPDDDEQLWGPDDLPDKTAWAHVELDDGGRWLVVHLALGWSRTDVHLVDLTTGRRSTVVAGVEATTAFQVVDGRLVGTTTLDADRGRVVAADPDRPTPEHWQTLVPESERVLVGVEPCGRELLVLSSHAALSGLDRHDLDGGHLGRVELPQLATVGSLSGGSDGIGFLTASSFTRPSSLHRLVDGRLEPWSDPDTAVDPDACVVEAHHYPSTDGTAVPLFLVGPADATGEAPTILTGYGGFSIVNGPAYSPLAAAWCEAGGRVAVAAIRGGAEYGEAWHRAGMREHKQQSFDDFFAAAEWLTATGRCRPDRLALRGGSNGGLLMGAAITQRPELAAAVHCAVPLLDMVRYHRFLIARLWIPEYGDPDEPDEFAWLHAYSPYHRVAPGTCYPATLLTTADGDSRVDPMHARKMAALLQAATSCGDRAPICLWVEDQAGHGVGKPVGKQAAELADVITFLGAHVGLDGRWDGRDRP